MARLTRTQAGVAMGVSAYVIWGLLPLYLKLLRPLPPVDILSHRILWSLLLLTIVAIAMRRRAALAAAIRNPRLLMTLIASALLIGVNWLIYVFAVNGAMCCRRASAISSIRWSTWCSVSSSCASGWGGWRSRRSCWRPRAWRR